MLASSRSVAHPTESVQLSLLRTEATAPQMEEFVVPRDEMVINWGIFSTARVAHSIVRAITECDDCECLAAASETAREESDFD